jgi:hypothetical protein
MRLMKTQAAFTALLFSSLLVSFAQAQAGSAEAGADKRPRIRLSDGSEKPGTEKPAPPSQAAPGGEKVLPETPESEVGTGPATGLGPASSASPGVEATEAEPQADGPPAAEPSEAEGTTAGAQAAGSSDDKSQPRVIDISGIAEEDLPPPAEPKLRGSELPFTYHLNHVDVSGGFRIVGTGSDGLEPFLVDPVLGDVYVRGGLAFGVTDRIAVAPHLEIGTASTSASVRGLSTELDKVHLSLGLEGRYHFIHRMFGYVRVAPGFEFVEASIGDGEESGTLVNDDKKLGSVAFQLDAALGASLRLFGSDDGRKRNPRLWAFTEGGYRASGDHQLSMVMEGGGPRRAVPIDLPPLNFSGGFFSMGILATF